MSNWRNENLKPYIQCIRTLMSPGYYNLTGKTISTNFDPWSADAFREHIDEITRSDLYTMRTDKPGEPSGRSSQKYFFENLSLHADRKVVP